MKRLVLVLIFLSLIIPVSSFDYVDEKRNLPAVESELMKYFCKDVRNNKECNIPSQWAEDFWGVCCGGLCNSFTKDCRHSVNSEVSLLDVMVKLPCKDAGTGDRCDIPDELSEKYNLWGICCYNKCNYWEEECSGGYEPDYRKDEIGYDEKIPSEEEIEKGLKVLAIFSCVGVKDDEPCQIDDRHLTEEFNLFGVCCLGKCHFRSTECTPETNETTPDLVIIGMEIYPGDLSNTLQIKEVKITIQNQGKTATTNRFWIELLKDYESAPTTKEIKNTLDAGEDIIISFYDLQAYKEPGEYILTATIDSNPSSLKDNLIKETDETNNKATLRIFIGGTIKTGTQPKENTDTPPLCGDGHCEEDEKKTCPTDCDTQEDESKESPLPALIILALFFAVFTYFRRLRKSSHDRKQQKQQMKELIDEKKTIEEMITLAKKKYHKRKIDEESFKEIIKENQKRLIEVETKIENKRNNSMKKSTTPP